MCTPLRASSNLPVCFYSDAAEAALPVHLVACSQLRVLMPMTSFQRVVLDQIKGPTPAKRRCGSQTQLCLGPRLNHFAFNGVADNIN